MLKKKKFGPVLKELDNFLPKNLSLSSKKYGVGIRDLRSGIRKKPITDPGSGSRVKKAPDPIRICITSVMDPDPVGSETFCRIRIRIRNKSETETEGGFNRP